MTFRCLLWRLQEKAEPWGIALLWLPYGYKKENETLDEYLTNKVFAGETGSEMAPDPADVAGLINLSNGIRKDWLLRGRLLML